MERLSMALKVIQDGMRQNTPTTVKTSVGKAAEVLGSLLNTHECLMKSGLEIQKRLESHPATKKIRIFQRPHSASLEDTPKSQAKGEKRDAAYPLRKKLLRGGRAARHPRIPKCLRARPQIKKRTGKWSQSVAKKIKKKLEKKAKDPVQKAQRTVAKLKPKSSSPARSGDAIKVSAKDGQSYADIYKEMKAIVDPQKAGLEVLSIRRTRKEEVLLVLKKGGDISAYRKVRKVRSRVSGL